MKEALLIPAGHDGAVWFYTSRSLNYPMHRHDELELNLVRRGTARYLLDNARHDLVPGSMLWLFPVQNHVLLDRSTDFEMWILVFRPRLLRRACTAADCRPLLEADPVGQHCRQLGPGPARRLDTLFRELTAANDTPALYNAGLGYALLAAWQASAAPGTWSLLGTDLHPAVEKAAELLRHETAPLPAVVLARRCGLSYSRLGALFKLQMGIALVDFRSQQRYERFLAIDGTGQRTTLLEAALAAGFGSYAQFHRVFKKGMGCSPSAYRRDLKKTSSFAQRSVQSVLVGHGSQ